MGWILIALGAVAAWVVTLAAGMWIGLTVSHEDSRAPAAGDSGRGGPAPRPPLTPLAPFPGQWLLEIQDPAALTGDTWHAEVLDSADELRARLDAHLDHALRVIREEAPGE